ncbi:hypothetical protein [Acanthopleuribacter pedis]|uniref:Uncharacterized protein n=1 Tax=Acanthopleuribacter pedis TaxID=442870 RepID=A0A8J7Q952_9BACT|nr:hypothetical protein [Acanthopleuribacter pedis]MBO1319719.1 hypothetical protein [Acanthopleuribacter pedis]
MRPEPIQKDRPFFRPEAEEHRLYRHLGEIVLFRPLATRLVSLLPLAALGLVGFGLMQIELQTKYEAVTDPTPSQEMRLILAEPTQLIPGEKVEWALGDTPDRRSATVLRVETGPCAPDRAGQPCPRVVLQNDGAPPNAAPNTRVRLWTQPKPFLRMFNDTPPSS